MAMPCKFDHNGECLVCDCWPSDCPFKELGANMNIFTLPRFEVIKPIPVVIEDMGGDNFVVGVEDANINASGDNYREALENLKDIICSRGELLLGMPDDKMVKPMQEVKRWLEDHLGKPL